MCCCSQYAMKLLHSSPQISCCVFLSFYSSLLVSRASNIKRRVPSTNAHAHAHKHKMWDEKNVKRWRTRQNSRTNTELEITYHWMTNSIILACRKRTILPCHFLFVSQFCSCWHFSCLFVVAAVLFTARIYICVLFSIENAFEIDCTVLDISIFLFLRANWWPSDHVFVCFGVFPYTSRHTLHKWEIFFHSGKIFPTKKVYVYIDRWVRPQMANRFRAFAKKK